MTTYVHWVRTVVSIFLLPFFVLSSQWRSASYRFLGNLRSYGGGRRGLVWLGLHALLNLLQRDSPETPHRLDYVQVHLMVAAKFYCRCVTRSICIVECCSYWTKQLRLFSGPCKRLVCSLGETKWSRALLYVSGVCRLLGSEGLSTPPPWIRPCLQVL